MRKLRTLLILFALSAEMLSAQTPDREHLGVSAFARGGHLMDGMGIYENLIETHDFASAGIMVGLNTRPEDNDWYAWAYNFPHYGLGFSYANMSGVKCHPESASGLGDAYTLFGYAHFDLLKTRHFSFGPNLELGTSFMTRKWDAVTNPKNFYVGTSMLIMVGAGLEAAFHITPRWELGLNAMLTHRSNGMLRTPNFGLNELAAGAFVRYDLSDRHLGRRGASPERPEFKKWLFDIYFSGGVHSCDAERGLYLEHVLKEGEENRWGSFRPWLRLNLGGTALFRYHPIFATGIGLDVSYTQNWKRLGEYYELVHGTAAKTCPVYVGAYLQQSFFYRNVEVGIGLGVYLFKKLGIEDSTWNYQRALIRWHLPKAGNIFLGFAMRAHRFDRSDTLEFSLGKRF